ncbi:hypothetical protein GCM10009809_37930 [Isoptericola hypogeus]|uniref:Dehydrogenase n=1 Tax=Isoptericola hypogeus TaxID=300179 RepID=A0ABN2JU11_9MICO
MPTIAIVGAGRGLGAAVAHEFATHGYDVALISRTQGHVDALAADVRTVGVDARGFAADARDPHQLAAALDSAATQLGTIEVLQYSPVPQRDFMKPVLETTADDLVAPVEQSVYGPVTAVQQVLPGMRSTGRGTIVLVNGGSAVRPGPNVAGTSVAFAAESAYGQLLHDALAPEGIHVGQLIIPRGIGAGEPSHEPAALAARIWAMHRDRGEFRTFAAELD